jgi:hypothetical protein
VNSRSLAVNSTGVLFATAYSIASILSKTQSNSDIRFKIQCITRWEVYVLSLKGDRGGSNQF